MHEAKISLVQSLLILINFVKHVIEYVMDSISAGVVERKG